MDKNKNFYFNIAFFKRFYRQLRIIMPRFCCPTTFLFLALLVIVLVEMVAVYFVGLIPSQYMKVLPKANKEEFWKRNAISSVVVVSMASVLAIKRYTFTLFYIKTRHIFTQALHKRYLHDINFYKVNVMDDTVDNADQRITQDIEKICKLFADLVPDLLVTPLNIIFYSYKTWSITGFLGPVTVYVFFIICTIVNKFLMSPIVFYTAQKEFYEGEFRYKHMQLRTNAESAAFYKCGNLEEVKIEEKLYGLFKAQKSVNNMEIFLTWSVNMANYFGMVLSYAVLAIPIFMGKYDEMSPNELSSLISKASFLTIYLLYNFTRLINMAPEVSTMAGCSHRVGELLETLDRCEHEGKDNNMNCGDEIILTEKPTGSYGEVAYSLRGVDIMLTRKSCITKLLCRDLNLDIRTGCSLLITGDSGKGKTSLLRTLDGLWPLDNGIISRNMPHGMGGVFYLPQRPYLTNGSLRHQITFPKLECDLSRDEEVLANLRITGLEELLSRTGGLDVEMDWHWDDVLSPGEAQRLAFVRLFYHRPAIAVLDEATSQVSESLEEVIYGHCVTIGMTLVSVGHRMTLTKYHNQELKLLEDGSWSINWLNESRCPAFNNTVYPPYDNDPSNPYMSIEDYTNRDHF